LYKIVGPRIIRECLSFYLSYRRFGRSPNRILLQNVSGVPVLTY